MSRYPQECPVFEVIGDGEVACDKAHVEAFGSGRGRYPDGGATEYVCIYVRIIDEDDCVASREYKRRCREVYGFLGFAARPHAIRPLTRAAREMLALVQP